MTKKSTPTNTDREYPTDDLGLAALLKTLHCPLLRTDESPDGLTFVFGNVSESYVAGYFAKTEQVAAKPLIDNHNQFLRMARDWKKQNNIPPRGGWR